MTQSGESRCKQVHYLNVKMILQEALMNSSRKCQCISSTIVDVGPKIGKCVPIIRTGARFYNSTLEISISEIHKESIIQNENAN